MNRVFVDTGGFYASLNRRDASHRDAARLFRRAQREHWFLFTTNLIRRFLGACCEVTLQREEGGETVVSPRQCPSV